MPSKKAKSDLAALGDGATDGIVAELLLGLAVPLDAVALPEAW